MQQLVNSILVIGHVSNRDFYMTAAEAKKYGIIDEVIKK